MRFIDRSASSWWARSCYPKFRTWINSTRVKSIAYGLVGGQILYTYNILLTNFCAPFFKEIPSFFLWGDPLETPHRTPAPEYCISSRKRRSFEVRGGGGGFRKEGGGAVGRGKKRRKKGRAKSAQNRAGYTIPVAGGGGALKM